MKPRSPTMACTVCSISVTEACVVARWTNVVRSAADTWCSNAAIICSKVLDDAQSRRSTAHALACIGLSSLEHIGNIGSAGGIGKEHLLQLSSTYATPDGHSKDINDLFGMGTKEVRAQDTLAVCFD